MSDILGMSDEDFLKHSGANGGPTEDQSSTDAGDTVQSASTDPTNSQGSDQVIQPENLSDEEQLKAVPPPVEAAATDSKDSNSTPSTGTEDQAQSAVPGLAADATAQMDASKVPGDPAAASTAAAADGSTGTDPKTSDQQNPSEGTADSPPDYEGFYKKIMTPFKANGKMIELRSPDEAVQLMQMGANYTRKMQELAPHRKVLMMLQDNGLMDEGKLSFLIDIEKKNPEAIKKLVKDAGLDPMEIDTNVEPAYREGNHRVSDDEAAFRSTLDDMRSSEAGKETLQIINADWDQASKDVLWKSPEIMTAIHDQRESGVYDLISAEVNRQRILGAIPANMPFIAAYKQVGDAMVAKEAAQRPQSGQTSFAPAAPAASQTAQPVVVATRVEAPKPTVANSDRASAASPTRTAPAPAKTFVNPLSMSDEEFMKLEGMRV